MRDQPDCRFDRRRPIDPVSSLPPREPFFTSRMLGKQLLFFERGLEKLYNCMNSQPSASQRAC